MARVKVYLDTSVVSYLQQEDAPERMRDTLELWEHFEAGEFEVCLSQVTIDELSRCPEPKRSVLVEYLERIEYTNVPLTDEVRVLTERIIFGVLKPKSRDDARHIAAAVVSGCDYILSWNFKHIVNIKTIDGVRSITSIDGYKNIGIITPSMLLGGLS